jgi:hypothetical protein
VLDALWIVAIILEQPAYVFGRSFRPIRFGLLILLPPGDAQNKNPN